MWCVSEMYFVENISSPIRHVCGRTLSMRQAIISLSHFDLWLDSFSFLGSLGVFCRGVPISLLS